MFRPNERVRELVCLSLAAAAVMMLSCGGATTGVTKVSDAAEREKSTNNLKQIGIAVNNVAADTPAQAYIPPAGGRFPNGGPTNATFFFHLLPYVEQGNLYNQFMTQPEKANRPVETFVAPLDTFNDGKSSLCSYAANAQFLSVDPPAPPRLTNGGRTGLTVIVAERSAKTKATWNAYTKANGPTPPSGPFFYVYYPPMGAGTQKFEPIFTDSSTWPSSASATSPPTALSDSGMMVLMLDGSTRIVTADNIAKKAWLIVCDPVNQNVPVPSNW
jgi:hypothetical protein